MAKESGSNKPADEIKADVARSRDRLAREFRAVRYELDIPRKIRRSFQQQTPLWIGAAVVVGTLLFLLPLRKRQLSDTPKSSGKSKRKLIEAGFALGALKIAASLLKPVIVNLIATKIRGYTSPERSTRL